MPPAPASRPALRIASVGSASASLSCAALALAIGPGPAFSPEPLALAGIGGLLAIAAVFAWRAADAAKDAARARRVVEPAAW